MAGHVEARKILALWPFAFHDDDVDVLGALEEGHRIGDRARGRAASIPAEGNMSEVEGGRMNIGHKQDRPAGFEDRGLGDAILYGLLVGVRLTNDGQIKAPG